MNGHSNVGSVSLVGAGPGDPDVLTVKAIKAIRRASALLVDDLVGAGVLRYARRSARIVHVSKRGGCASTAQAFIHKLMVAETQRGETVMRLKGGDPSSSAVAAKRPNTCARPASRCKSSTASRPAWPLPPRWAFPAPTANMRTASC